jgi:hypothetical protein
MLPLLQLLEKDLHDFVFVYLIKTYQQRKKSSNLAFELLVEEEEVEQIGVQRRRPRDATFFLYKQKSTVHLCGTLC